MDCYVITFPSVAHAFRAEKILKQRGIDVKLIPIPRALSGCCEGLAARVDEQQISGAVEILRDSGVVMLYQGIKVKSE